jgi:hypothetical protein
MSKRPRILILVVAALCVALGAGVTTWVATGGERRVVADQVTDILRPGEIGDQTKIQEVTSLVLNSSVTAALEKIAEYRNNRTANCHDLSHAVGRAAWTRYQSISVAFKEGYDVCDFGYYHGIVEAAGAQLGAEEFVIRIPAACEELVADNLRYSQCTHGAGHGAFYIEQGDMGAAMSLCVGFKSGLKQACETGVSMEWFHSYQYYPEKLTPNTPNPRLVCSMLLEAYRPSCYAYLYTGVNANMQTDDDIKREVQWCYDNADSNASDCIISLSRVALSSMGRAPTLFKNLCPKDGEDRSLCIANVMLVWTLNVGPTIEEFDDTCKKLLPIDTAPGGGCTAVRPQVADTLARGATDAPTLDQFSGHSN